MLYHSKLAASIIFTIVSKALLNVIWQWGHIFIYGPVAEQSDLGNISLGYNHNITKYLLNVFVHFMNTYWNKSIINGFLVIKILYVFILLYQ